MDGRRKDEEGRGQGAGAEERCVVRASGANGEGETRLRRFAGAEPGLDWALEKGMADEIGSARNAPPP